MKGLIYGLIIVILTLLASYVAISVDGTSGTSGSYGLMTFEVSGNKENIENVNIGHNNIQTFVVGHGTSGRDMLIGIKKGSKCARERNLRYQAMEEEIERCIKKITKNWERTYYKKSYNKYYDDDENEWKHEEWSPFYEKRKEFWGYDEDEDFKLRWKLRNRALDGEEIC